MLLPGEQSLTIGTIYIANQSINQFIAKQDTLWPFTFEY